MPTSTGKHMRCEEHEILPLAQKHLTAGDWEAIDAAFTGHTDPLFREKAGDDVHKLFQRDSQPGAAADRSRSRAVSTPAQRSS